MGVSFLQWPHLRMSERVPWGIEFDHDEFVLFENLWEVWVVEDQNVSFLFVGGDGWDEKN